MKQLNLDLRAISRGGTLAMEAWLLLLLLLLLLGARGPVMGHDEPPACPVGGFSSSSVCTCGRDVEGMKVQCNGRRLYRLPASVPTDTIVLNAADNGITAVRKGELFGLEMMRTLFLQNNAISYIESGAFDNLYVLELLVLNNNKLREVTAGMFQHLTSIKSIDLSYNDIIRIDQRAFITLPASNAPLVTIKLQGNAKLRCDCNARALRDWADSLADDPANRRLARIVWEGFRCRTAQGVTMELQGLSDRQFTRCRQGVGPMFEPNQQCSTCRAQSTQLDCDARGTSVCSSSEAGRGRDGAQAMCMSRVERSGLRWSVTKQCSSHAECLTRERQNSRRCLLDPALSPDTAPLGCIFCCAGSQCNERDMGGRTLSQELRADFRFEMPFLPYMQDPNDAQYRRDADFYQLKITEMFEDFDGGFTVQFQSFSDESPCTHVSTLLHTIALPNQDDKQTIQFLYNKMVGSATAGFLKQHKAAHYYVGAVGIAPNTTSNCLRETRYTRSGRLVWEATNLGDTAQAQCPRTSRYPMNFATRRCIRGNKCVAQWDESDMSACDRGVRQSTTTTPTTTTTTTTTTTSTTTTESSTSTTTTTTTTTATTTPSSSPTTEAPRSTATAAVREWTSADVGVTGSWDGVFTSGNVTQRLRQLSKMVITRRNVDAVLVELDNVTSEGSTSLISDDVTLAMKTVDRALAQAVTLESARAMGHMVSSLSNLLDADERVWEDADASARTANRLVSAADKISTKGRLERNRLMFIHRNLVVGAQKIPSGTFRGLTMSVDPEDEEAFKLEDVSVELNSRTAQDGKISQLVLPATMWPFASGSRVALTVHRTGKAFKAMQHTPESTEPPTEDVDYVTTVNSHVMAVSIVGHDIMKLEDPITFSFVHRDLNSTNARCVFWEDADLQWSSRGCRKVDRLSDDRSTTCQCDHLTSFALLMDVYGHGIWLSEKDKKILSVISFIGCGLSLLCLILTLLTYIWFRKLRRDNPSKILINLCIALLLTNLVFVTGMHPYALDSLVGCKIVAVLLHFFLLSSLCWMAVEAFYMYLALVLVFKTYFTHFLLKCSLVGWGIPAVIVVLTLSINNTNNYGPLLTGVCWLKTVPFYVAFVGPVCLILLINVTVFGLVLRQILGLSERRTSSSTTESISVAQQLRGAVGVAILLGLTWVFAILAIDRASVPMYYLFAIFNTLQGVWIFVFYCLMKREARAAWMRALKCFPPPEKSAVSSSKNFHERSDFGTAGYSLAGAGSHRMRVISNDTNNTTGLSDAPGTASSSLTQLDSVHSQC